MYFSGSFLYFLTTVAGVFGSFQRTYQSFENQRRVEQFGKPRSMCSHCHKPVHTRDICYILHGPPPSYDPIVLREYNELLQDA